jgi:2'-5' RNA ligase
MKKHRIFIAINLPEPIKKKLLEFQRPWAALPVRWTKKPNLHLTLVFIGYVTDQELWETCQLARQVVQKHQPFEIKFKKICLGPPGKPARMIWLEGETNPALAQLKNDLEETLFNSAKSGFNHRENRAFRPHLTLARMRIAEWRALADKPKIDREISLSFSVGSVEIMESFLSRKGPDYTILESLEL